MKDSVSIYECISPTECSFYLCIIDFCAVLDCFPVHDLK